MEAEKLTKSEKDQVSQRKEERFKLMTLQLSILLQESGKLNLSKRTILMPRAISLKVANFTNF